MRRLAVHRQRLAVSHVRRLAASDPRPLAAGATALALAVLALGGCGSSSGKSGSSGSANSAGNSTGHGSSAHGGAVPARRVARLVPPPGAPPVTVHVPVLTFHRVNRLRPGANAIETDLTIEPAVFVAEMDALRRAGYHSITQAQLFGALWEHRALPPKPVLISVDDGYVDDVKRILPILRRDHLVATFFVITGRFQVPGFMNAAQIRELDRAGMDVGDHTRTHIDLTLIPPAKLVQETAGSRAVLQRVLGHPVYFFAYPFGRTNDAVRAELRRAGFTMAYTTAGGTHESTTAPLAMPRLHIGRAETPAGLLSLLASS